MDIIVFKTIIGQEIVAKLISTEDNGDIVVNQPLSMNIVGVDDTGHAELQMMPLFMMNPTENITICERMIGTLPMKAPEGLDSEYIQQTTGIDLIGV